jgi:Leucine Rich repeat
MTEPIKRRPKWLRFSLRTLLVVMTVLCVWLGFKVNAARRQKEAVAAILNAEGSVRFDYQMVPDPIAPDDASKASWRNQDQSTPPGPVWLRKAIGDEYFREVLEVAIQQRVVADQDFGKLAELPRLRILYLIGRIPDGSTDFGGGIEIESPSGNRHLISDADLAVLEQLPELEVLGIYPAEIDGHGLAHVVNLHRLKHLVLLQTQLNDAGMEQIGKMTTLEGLTVSRTRITDAGLVFLQRLINLKTLDIRNTEITDAGLQNLKSLMKLTRLDLRGTHVTREGVRDLQTLLPTCKIISP